jgi:hypothetical protein
MSITASTPTEVVLRDYLHAKDENRPHLLERVFTGDAVLEILNRTSTITFPAVTSGREAIADVLVRDFGQTYENVYSFYLQRPSGHASSFECEWIVAMTEKASRNLRIGCGRYAWEFESTAPNRARRLVITIAEMQVLPASVAREALTALSALGYPWSSPDEVRAAASSHAILIPIVQRLAPSTEQVTQTRTLAETERWQRR